MTVLTVGGTSMKLHPASQFFLNTEALLTQRNLYTYEGESKEEIEERIHKNFENVVYGLKPHVSLNVYFFERGDQLTSVRVTVKPIGNSRMPEYRMLEHLHAVADKNMYATLVEDFVKWLELYNSTFCSINNLHVLNAKIAEIKSQVLSDSKYNVQFGLGSGIQYIDDYNIVLGVEPSTLANLEANPLFSESADEYSLMNMRSIVASYLTEIEEKGLIEAVTTSPFTTAFGISTRNFGVQVSNLVRNKLANDKTKLRKGLNIYRGEVEVEAEKIPYLAVLDVQPVSDEMVKEYADLVVAYDNPSPTKQELADGLTKYAVYFKLSPTARKRVTEEAKQAISQITLADITATIQ